MQPFEYYKPKDFDEAFKLLTLPGKVMYPLAGATDLIPHTRDGAWKPDGVVDIKGLPGLRDLKVAGLESDCGGTPGECLYVGAAVRMNEIARSALVCSHWDVLAQAAAAMGNEQVRNRATLGGNLGTASPAADSAPALLVLEASVLVKGPEGDRAIAVDRFFVGPKRSALKKGEIIVGILIPKPPEGSVALYEKLSRRQAGDLAIVGVAVMASPFQGGEMAGMGWRVALGAVAPTPIRSPQAEARLNAGYDDAHIDEAAAAACGCSRPIDDVRASAAYRQMMVVNITRRIIQRVITLQRLNG
ncbi:MAG TPA: xanthine dehydrogenase family protein subunit M [Anaerolineae bacterium]|nr:xanthine dehydrogenase family protein subunit M [Anaerolineae bacterium]HQH38063.1 xanthine dehydrogenase family protein subunit M [Anaerolineae bacterium]